MSRYLVTGAGGFLGRHLVRRLLTQGHEVVALVRSHDAELARTKARLVAGDVLRPETLLGAMKGCDGVFHGAGKVSRDPADAAAMHTLHVIGTRNVLNACRETRVPRLVLVSTSGTVGISEKPEVKDEDSVRPITLIQRFPYYRTKLFAEEEALLADKDSGRPTAIPGLTVVSVNPSLLLGPGDLNGSSTKDVWLFLDRALPATPAGGMSFVDARDAAEGLILAMQKGVGGRRYLLTARNCTLGEFFDSLSRVSDVPAPRVTMPRMPRVSRLASSLFGRAIEKIGGERPVDDVTIDMSHLYWWVSAERAKRELGWEPRDPMDTLADTVNDLRGRPIVEVPTKKNKGLSLLS
jgi:dihydroflavonol-4-reductase